MLRKDIVVTFGGQVARVTLGIIGTAVLARALGPEGRGLYALAILLPVTIGSFLQAGHLAVNLTFAGLYRDQRRALFVQSVLYSVVAGALAVLAMAAYFFWLPVGKGQLESLPGGIILIGLMLIPMQMMAALLRALTRGSELIVQAVLVDSAGMVLRVLALIAFVWLLGGGLPAAMWVTLGLPAFCIVAFLWQIRNIATLDVRNLSWPLAKQSMQFGGVLAVASVARLLVMQVGLYLLNYMKMPPAEIGFYAVALVVSRQLQMIPEAVSQAFLPRASNDPEVRLKQIPPLFRLTLIVCLGMMFLMAAAGPPLMLLMFGWNFAGSILPYLFLLPGVAFHGSARLIGMYLYVRQKPHYGMINNWIALACTVALSVVLIRRLGITGAALGYSLGMLLVSVLTIWAYRRVSGTALKELVPQRSDFRLLWGQFRRILASPRRMLARGKIEQTTPDDPAQT